MNTREMYLKNKFRETGIEISDQQVNQFLVYYEYLVERNKVMNLTGITEFEEVVQKHFVDSLSLVYAGSVDQYKTLIDVGTGAGFPGIPVKIVFPHLKVVLLDSIHKRIGFLQEVVDKLGLDDVECVHDRAEDAAKSDEYREKFDLCVSRAVADLSVLSELCMPFIAIDGAFISYKSGNAEEEITKSEKSVDLLGGTVVDKKAFHLPGSDIGRILVVIKKVKNTPMKYPRKPGVIKKRPL